VLKRVAVFHQEFNKSEIITINNNIHTEIKIKIINLNNFKVNSLNSRLLVLNKNINNM